MQLEIFPSNVRPKEPQLFVGASLPPQPSGRPANKWLALSAFHKEARRSSVRGMTFYANFTERPPSLMKKYIASIWFEESRDVKGFLDLHENWKDIDLPTAIRMFAAAPKKWELESRGGAYAEFLRAWRRRTELGITQVPFSAAAIDAVVQGRVKLPMVYDTLWSGLTPKEGALRPSSFQSGFMAAVKEAAKQSPHDIIREFGHAPDAVWTADTFYSIKVVLESGLLFYPEWIAPVERVDPFDQPPPSIPLYVYDHHGMDGKMMMMKYGVEFLTKKQSKGLDMRLSGMIPGVCWREIVRKNPMTFDWTRTVFSDEIWRDVILYDFACYPQMYEQQRFRELVK